MKKYFVLPLILILMLQIAGCYVYFFFRLTEIHHESREALRQLPSDQLDRLEMSKETYELSLVEEDEIRFQGKMYDIAKIERKHGIVIIFARHDAAEDNLLSFISNVLKTIDNDTTPIPSLIVQLTGLVFLFPEFNSLHTPSFLTVNHSTRYYSFYSEVTLPPGTRPPSI